MLPSKPSSKESIACVGELVGSVLIGCSRRPLKFVVAMAPKGFGLGDVEEADHPSVKVCGACSRHVDELVEALRLSSPEDHRTDPMVFSLNELLEIWDDFFEDLFATIGGHWESDGKFR